MAKMPRRGRIWRRIIMSYVLVALIPIFLFSWLILVHFVGALSTEVERNLAVPLERSLENLELELARLTRMAAAIEVNPKLSATDLGATPYAATDLRRELRNISDSQLLDEVFYYNRRYGRILGYNYATTPEVFSSFVLQSAEAWTEVEAFLASDERRLVRHYAAEQLNLSDRSAHLLLLYKLPQESGRASGLVFFFIPMDRVVRALQPGLVGDSALLLVDPDSERTLLEVANSEAGSALIAAWRELDAADALAGGGDEPGGLLYRDRQLQLRDYRIAGLPWTLLRLSPRNALGTRVSTIRLVYLGAIAALSLLLVLTIHLMARLNYRPIQRMRRLIEEVMEPDGSDDSLRVGAEEGDEGRGEAPQRRRRLRPLHDELDELERMEALLLAYGERHSALLEELSASEQMRRSQLIDTYLMGQAAQIEQLDRLLASARLHFDRPCYRAVVLRGKTAPLSAAALEPSIHGAFAGVEGLDVQLILHDDRQAAAVIALVGSEEGELVEGQIRLALTRLLQEMEEAGRPLGIGIGTRVDDIVEIAQSYESALRVMDWLDMRAGSALLSYAELDAQEGSDLRYPQELMDELALGLEQRDRYRVRTCFGQLEELMAGGDMNLHLAKHLLMDLWSLLTRRMIDDGRSQSLLLDKPFVRRIYLSQPRGAADIAALLHEVEGDYETWLEGSEDVYELQQVQAIVRYIREHGLDPQFNLNALADALDMSRPYLSQYFKKQTDQSISDYVTRLRLERARSLLVETDTSVQEIAEAVGYYSVSSFIRKFRESEGMTPGQYRREHGGT